MIDWTLPIFAQRTRHGSGRALPRVEVDETYASKPGLTPVRFSKGLWAEGPGGTWYVNYRGQAIGGLGPDGYNGHFLVSNEPEEDTRRAVKSEDLSHEWIEALEGAEYGQPRGINKPEETAPIVPFWVTILGGRNDGVRGLTSWARRTLGREGKRERKGPIHQD